MPSTTASVAVSPSPQPTPAQRARWSHALALALLDELTRLASARKEGVIEARDAKDEPLR